MNDITVLLSAAGSPTIPGLIGCFRNNRERNIKIVGIDMTADATIELLVDRFYEVSPVSDPGYWKVVYDICQKEKVDIYFPNISAEVSEVIKHKDKFENIGVKLAISSLQSVEVANNKFETYKLLKKSNIPVPEFYHVRSVSDFREGCQILGYPEKAVCLKIVSGSGSRGVRIIDKSKSRYDLFVNSKPNSLFSSYEDMISILSSVNQIDEMMLMPYLSGNEYTVDILAENGRVLYEVGRDNVVSLMSIAQESIIERDKNAYDIAQSVVELLNYDGNIGIDFMKDAYGNTVLTDINPRITATVSLISAGGVNLPYLRVKQLLGEKLPNVNIKYGTRMKRRYMDMFVDIHGNEVKW